MVYIPNTSQIATVKKNNMGEHFFLTSEFYTQGKEV